MEEEKPASYSITEKLFGSTQCADTSEVIKAIFSPKSKALGKAVVNSEVADKNESTKTNIENEVKINENDEKHGWGMKTLYDEQRVNQPCGLSSSLYYGGQDFYHPPQGTPNPPLLNKDVGDGETEAATRGDWWQGSLYY